MIVVIVVTIVIQHNVLFMLLGTVVLVAFSIVLVLIHRYGSRSGDDFGTQLLKFDVESRVIQVWTLRTQRVHAMRVLRLERIRDVCAFSALRTIAFRKLMDGDDAVIEMNEVEIAVPNETRWDSVCLSIEKVMTSIDEEWPRRVEFYQIGISY